MTTHELEQIVALAQYALHISSLQVHLHMKISSRLELEATFVTLTAGYLWREEPYIIGSSEPRYIIQNRDTIKVVDGTPINEISGLSEVGWYLQ